MRIILLLISLSSFDLFTTSNDLCKQLILESFRPSGYCCYDEESVFFENAMSLGEIDFALDVYHCKYSSRSGKLHLSGMLFYETELGNIKTTDIQHIPYVTIFKGIVQDENLFITDTIQIATIKGEFSFDTKLSSEENVYFQISGFRQHCLKLN